jgi:hypothetical protein
MADTEQKISIIHNDISISHCIRRITKMTSNVETGTDQAAFDVAIEKEIAQLSETTRARGQFWVVVWSIPLRRTFWKGATTFGQS